MAKKMSRAMARKRIDEARSKLLRVLMAADLPTREDTELFKMTNALHRLSTKLK